MQAPCCSRQEQDRDLRGSWALRLGRRYSWHLSQLRPSSVWGKGLRLRMAGDEDLTSKGRSETGQSSSVVAFLRKTAWPRLGPGRLQVSAAPSTGQTP